MCNTGSKIIVLKQYKLNAYYCILQSWLFYIPVCLNYCLGRYCKSIKNKMLKIVIRSGSGPMTIGTN